MYDKDIRYISRCFDLCYISLSTKFSLFIWMNMSFLSVCVFLSPAQPPTPPPSKNRDQYVTVFLLSSDRLAASVSYLAQP